MEKQAHIYYFPQLHLLAVVERTGRGLMLLAPALAVPDEYDYVQRHVARIKLRTRAEALGYTLVPPQGGH